MNALKRVLAKAFKDDFKPFKTENKGELPNRAEFTGDKEPSKTGDPAKVELTDWHEGQSKFDGFRRKEKKDDYTSLVNTPEGHQEKMSEATAKINTHKWFTKIANIVDTPETYVQDAGVPADITGSGVSGEPPKENSSNTIASTKMLWRKRFSGSFGEPDINLKRKPDGTMELNVTHPAGGVNEEEQAPDQSLQSDNTQMQVPAPTPTAATDSTQPAAPAATASLEKTASAEDVKEWIIRKEGNLVLLGRECKDRVGIFLLQFPQGVLSKAASLKDKLKFAIDKEVHARNGHEWRALINSSLWESKFDQLLKK